MTTNAKNTVLYTGVTSNLKNRTWKYKTKFYPHSFSAKYNTTKLVYWEGFHLTCETRFREKRNKGDQRPTKLNLFTCFN